MMLVLLLLLAAPAAAEPFADRVVGYTIGTVDGTSGDGAFGSSAFANTGYTPAQPG